MGSRFRLKPKDLVKDFSIVTFDVVIGNLDDCGMNTKLLILFDDLLKRLFSHGMIFKNISNLIS